MHLLRFIIRILSAVLIPLIVSVCLLVYPKSNFAASGGRIGGSNFQAPSISRTRSYGGGSYGGNYYRRGGIGFPFLFPFFGFGGGGLFGFLILMTITGVIANALRAQPSSLEINTSNPQGINSGPITLFQIQLGLLAKAKDTQLKLRKLANSADTSTPIGLQKILQETTLYLLRQPELWVYANIENGSVPFASAESTFNRISLTERSKLKAELTTNISGHKNSSENTVIQSGDSAPTNEYIAVTILLASRTNPRTNSPISSEELIENLKLIGSISSKDLIALEIIWQPEGDGEVLTATELVTSYPNLVHL